MLKGYVYILTNKRNGTLYTGVTKNIQRRIYEHKSGIFEGFTKKYKLDVLVHLEVYDTLCQAIAREKRLKKWRRSWKLKLIEDNNPECNDLSQLMDFMFV